MVHVLLLYPCPTSIGYLMHRCCPCWSDSIRVMLSERILVEHLLNESNQCHFRPMQLNLLMLRQSNAMHLVALHSNLYCWVTIVLNQAQQSLLVFGIGSNFKNNQRLTQNGNEENSKKKKEKKTNSCKT